MHIARPPFSLGMKEFNQRKQRAVFERVYDPAHDTLLPTGAPTRADLYRVHTPAYVEGVISGARVNGFGTRDYATTLHALASCHALDAAARAALAHGVAFAPASGFHHAGYAHGGGYCTFNGLMMVAAKLAPSSVLILDGDAHWGDGCEDIARHVALPSVHYHSTPGALDRAAADALLERYKPALVLYQAGADAHADDPYRAGGLTDAEWLERDLSVFTTCRARGVPVAWCLAGGYNGAKTLQLHEYTFAAAVSVFYPGQTRLHAAPDLLKAMAEDQGPQPEVLGSACLQQ